MKIETHEKVYADALFEWGVDGSRMAFFAARVGGARFINHVRSMEWHKSRTQLVHLARADARGAEHDDRVLDRHLLEARGGFEVLGQDAQRPGVLAGEELLVLVGLDGAVAALGHGTDWTRPEGAAPARAAPMSREGVHSRTHERLARHRPYH